MREFHPTITHIMTMAYVEHLKSIYYSPEWFKLSKPYPFQAKIRLTRSYSMELRITGRNWMIDVKVQHSTKLLMIRNVRGNYDQIYEDLLAAKLSI